MRIKLYKMRIKYGREVAVPFGNHFLIFYRATTTYNKKAGSNEYYQLQYLII